MQEQLGDARAGRPPLSDASDQPPVTQVQQAPGLPLTTSAGAAYTKDITFMVFSDDDIDPADEPRPSAGAASTMPSDHATPVPIAAAQAQASAMPSIQALVHVVEQARAPAPAQAQAQAFTCQYKNENGEMRQATAQAPATAQVPQTRGRSPGHRTMT